MRHDAKLGLALGMLVIGFAVAFCFPRQPERAAWQKPVVPLPSRNAALDFLPIRAYQHPPAVASPPSESKTVPTPGQAELLPAAGLTPISIGGEPIHPSQLNHRAGMAEVPPPVVPLIPVAPSRPDPLTSDPPASVDSSRPVTSSSRVEPVNVSPFTEAPQQESDRTYEVKAGDTLSGIASRSLGSANRYLELFEANRDILSSPNDLKIGMQLRIPSPDAPRISKQESLREPPSVQKSWSGPPASGPRAQERDRSKILQPPTVPWLVERPQNHN